MSLRARLTLLAVGMVAAAVIVLSALQLNSLIGALIDHAVERSQTTAQTVKDLVLERVARETAARGGAPPSLAESKRLWTGILERDQELAERLARTLAGTRLVVEIAVASETGRILVSSNPARTGTPMVPRLPLRTLQALSMPQRLAAILAGRQDYESLVPLGVPEQAQPIFTIQVLVSSLLLRDALVPDMRRTALVSLATLALATLLAYSAARLALRPLARISQAIDRIASGEPSDSPAPAAPSAREFAIVEQKLSLLGQQFRGARPGAAEPDLAMRLAAINRLTGGVAHEIKNPLNSIALRLELLRAKVREDAPEAGPEIEVISQEVTRLDRVVRTFLDFTRPVELARRELDLTSLVDEVLTLIRPEAERAGVSIASRPAPLPIRIHGDADLLKQAILNVVRNALDAMPGGGKVTVDIGKSEDCCEVTVSDTGPGISPENRERIFQLYFTTKQGGSGIGLAMAYLAAQLHGGTIDVGGQEGRGATFTIRLPLGYGVAA